MTTENAASTYTSAAVAAQGAHVAPGKGTSKKGASTKNGAPGSEMDIGAAQAGQFRRPKTWRASVLVCGTAPVPSNRSPLRVAYVADGAPLPPFGEGKVSLLAAPLAPKPESHFFCPAASRIAGSAAALRIAARLMNVMALTD